MNILYTRFDYISRFAACAKVCGAVAALKSLGRYAALHLPAYRAYFDALLYSCAAKGYWVTAGFRFSSFAELNAWLAVRCKTLWSELRHTEYPDLTIADVLEHEQTQLMPMPTPFDGYVEVMAKVSSTCLVTVDRNRYSVPCQFANRLVSVHQYPEQITVYVDHARITCHARFLGRDQVRYDWQHYINIAERKPGVLRNGAPFLTMPAPLLHLQKALLRRDGGDRVMAQVLACVPQHGLEAVLVAVELVLESGAVSAEHVTNVLARLQHTPAPPSVGTSLHIAEEPIFDTGRYDSLHQEADHV